MALRFESRLRETLHKQTVLGVKPTISLEQAILEYSSMKQGAITKRNIDAQIRVLNTQVCRVYPLSSDLHGINDGHITQLITLRRQ
jgi:hypothetical protein